VKQREENDVSEKKRLPLKVYSHERQRGGSKFDYAKLRLVAYKTGDLIR